jgi:hypothetical protein
MDDAVIAPVEAPVTAPPPTPAAPPDLSTEIREIHSMLDDMRQSNEPDIPALRDADSGQKKAVFSGVHDASRHLARRRREAAAQGEAQPSEPGIDLEIRDLTDRPEIDPKQAAVELADYRQRMAAQLLEGIDPATAAARASGFEQPAEAPQPAQPESEPTQQSEQSERTHYTRVEVETAAVQQLQGYQERLGAILLAIRGVAVPNELSQIQSPEQWAALQAADPHKAAQIADYVGRRQALAQQLETELGAVQQQKAQIQQAQFQRYAEEQDQIFEQAVPEMRSGGSRELQEAAAAVLKDVGLSDQDVRAAWNGAPISLRSAAAQRILADAARWRMAQAKAKAAIARATPPPQRPGVRQDIRASVADLNALSRKLDEAGSAQQQLKLAGRLVAERRRSAQG